MTDAKPQKVAEKAVDPMADAPPARPYSEAVTPEHKQTLVEAGLWREDDAPE